MRHTRSCRRWRENCRYLRKLRGHLETGTFDCTHTCFCTCVSTLIVTYSIPSYPASAGPIRLTETSQQRDQYSLPAIQYGLLTDHLQSVALLQNWSPRRRSSQAVAPQVIPPVFAQLCVASAGMRGRHRIGDHGRWAASPKSELKQASFPNWVWLKIKQEGLRRFGPCFHLPGFHFGTGLLSHSQFSCDSNPCKGALMISVQLANGTSPKEIPP